MLPVPHSLLCPAVFPFVGLNYNHPLIIIIIISTTSLVNVFLSVKAKARLMDRAQTMNINAVTGSASLCSMPVTTMTTVETCRMSLAAVSPLAQ